MLQQPVMFFGCILMTIQVCIAGMTVNWCPAPCACYNDHATVDCSQRGLTSIPRLSNQTVRLYLDGNYISSLPEGVLMDLPRLGVLNLQDNDLREVNTTSFGHLPSLQQLYLGGNQIAMFTVVDEGDANTQLQELEIHGNLLQEIPVNLSRFAPNLETLDLSRNHIESCQLDSSFVAMQLLRQLDLHGNQIRGIEDTAFGALAWPVTLKSLNLAGCDLFHIGKRAFSMMTNLTFLSLADNPLSRQNLEQVFHAMGNESRLLQLYLQHMPLYNISTALLESFVNLQTLDLSYCQSAHVDQDVFDNLPSLEILRLEGNTFRELGNITVLTSLRELYLHDNQLSAMTLRGLKNLQVVDLSRNQFVSLPVHWLTDTNVLHSLNLSRNAIATIDDESFHKVSLHTLDLSHNRLQVLHSYGVLTMRRLLLGHNLLSSVTEDALNNMHTSIQELDLSHNRFTHFPSYILDDFFALQRLDLSNNQLGQTLKQGHLKSLFHSLTHLQVLHLCNNNITEITHSQFRYLHHLTTLYLHANNIRDLAMISLDDLKSLSKLHVSHNRLTMVDTSVLKKLRYIEVVDFSDNPYDCSCGLPQYVRWLNATVVTVLHFNERNKYLCSLPTNLAGRNILSIKHSRETCPKRHLMHDLVLLGIVIASVAGLLVLVALVFYFGKIWRKLKNLQYKWQVRYREVSGVELTAESTE